MNDDRTLLVIAGGGLVVLVAALIVGLSAGPEHDYTTMCQNADYIRLEDDACERGDRGSTVMYISTSSDYHAPAVGQRIDQSKMIRVVPKGKTIEKAKVPKEGGVVKASPGITRGGFGGKSGSAS